MSTSTHPSPESPFLVDEIDLTRKFVKVLERRVDGLVSFEFSIGWPELSVELLLPAVAFDAFCATNRVVWRQD